MPFCLIVDDDDISREIGSMVVREIGLEAGTASDAITGLAMCERRMPDVIILDFMMPNMTGADFLHELHKRMGGRKPYVIACTALSDLNTVKIMQKEDVNDYVVKPFDPKTLQEKIYASGIIHRRQQGKIGESV